MVNYIPLNCTSDEDRELSGQLKKDIEECFKYTQQANVHVLFNFKSPVNIMGIYSYVMFIDVPYAKGNMFKSRNAKTFLNNLVIAIKEYEDNSILDVTNDEFINDRGAWNYKEDIQTEEIAMNKFIRENIPGLKFISFTVYHKVSSSNCPFKGRKGNLVFNSPIYFYDLISHAVETNSTNDNRSCNSVLYSDDYKKRDLSDFISNFIDVSESRTNQGILSKKKCNLITQDSLKLGVQQLISDCGTKLYIIKGKAGTGKSLVLTQVLYNKVKKDGERRNHRCRFLTYNNLLVMDIKNTLKNMGEFTESLASISTLHKFFMDVYCLSPVKILHMDAKAVRNLFAKCHRRVCNMVNWFYYYKEQGQNNIEVLKVCDELVKNGKIIEEDAKECRYFCKYLYNKNRYVNFGTLQDDAKNFELQKREMFDAYYAQREFLNGYNQILQEMYLMFHNMDEFISVYGMQLQYNPEVLKDTIEFHNKYEKLYDDFMAESKRKFIEEQNLTSEDDISRFFEEEDKLLEDVRESYNGKDNMKTNLDDSLKSIIRKVKWSDLVIVDEAQDCTQLEKDLLMEMFGSNNIIISSGGKDQLIRSANETNWESFHNVKIGNKADLILKYVYRQKACILNFLNAFSDEFKLNANLQASPSTRNAGRVIIDARTGFKECELPEDMMDSLYLSGKDNGCSDYENIMFMVPGGNYMSYTDSGNQYMDVSIDKNDTIEFKRTNRSRKLAVKFPEHFKILDCTINNKGELFNKVGNDMTRCLLYESCRGLEAWNVMCLDLDKFYTDKCSCADAESYAMEREKNEIFKGQLDLYKANYAAIWVYMAITRAMDTLYIKLSSPNSYFSQKLINVAKRTEGVEILEGEYVRPSLQQQ